MAFRFQEAVAAGTEIRFAELDLLPDTIQSAFSNQARMPEPVSNALLTLRCAETAAERERAWSEFLEVHSGLMLHVARSLGGGHDDVMDRYTFMLESLERDDYRRLRGFVADGRCTFSTWLIVVSRRLCLDHHRKRYGRLQSKEA